MEYSWEGSGLGEAAVEKISEWLSVEEAGRSAGRAPAEEVGAGRGGRWMSVRALRPPQPREPGPQAPAQTLRKTEGLGGRGKNNLSEICLWSFL